MAHSKVSLAAVSAGTKTSNDLVGVLCMVLSEIFLATVNCIVKLVPWPSQKIMVVRYSVDFVLCLCICFYAGIRPPSRGVAVRLALRGAAYCGFMLFFWGALRSCLPLGDVTVLVVASSPLFLVIAARALLGEEIPRRWPLQFAVCVIGGVLINKPWANSIERDCPASTALLPLGSGVCGAMMNLASRSVKEVPPPLVCLFNDVTAVVVGAMYLALNGMDVTGRNQEWVVGLVVLSAVIGCAGLLCNVKGYQSVSFAGIASIAGYTSVPVGYACQVFLFGQVPDLLSGLGAFLVCAISVSTALEKLLAAKAASDSGLSLGATKLDQYIKLKADGGQP